MESKDRLCVYVCVGARVYVCVASTVGLCQMSLVRQTLRAARILFNRQTQKWTEAREREKERENDDEGRCRDKNSPLLSPTLIQ